MDAERHRRLKDLFFKARELSPKERDEFLSAASRDDPDLQRELDLLLRHDSSHTLLTTPTPASLSNLSTQVGPWTPSHASDITVAAATASWVRLAPAGSLITLFAVLMIGLVILNRAQGHLMRHEAEQLQAHCLQARRGLSEWITHQFALAADSAQQAELVRALELQRAEPARPPKYTDVEVSRFIQRSLERDWGPETRFSMWNREMVRVYGSPSEATVLGNRVTETGAQLLSRVFRGESVIRLPNNSEMLTENFRLPPEAPKLAFIVPVYSQPATEGSPEILGALLIRSGKAERSFHEFFMTSQFLRTGEMYAYSPEGRMISQSRMLDQIRQLGLLETDPDVPGTEFVSLRDPGVDLTMGEIPAEPRAMQPETLLVRQSRMQPRGVNIKGYRDYRGRNVVGAWEWLEPHQFGIALEIDYDEVIEPLQTLRLGTWLTGLALGVCGLWIIVCRVSARRKLRQAAQDHSRIGPYVLGELLGEGGMGKVYLAQHDWLKRPTALKVLKSELNTTTMIRRFMREVQCASRLQHPNTVDIYDYGSTEDGRFFYAMEYLIGISLQQLVTMFGPIGPTRAIVIGQQLCGSLREAHQQGLVHRDIKPQNIMVCVCGGEADVVKVVDFGLVKETGAEGQQGDTGINEWAGTPKYMAPERILQPSLADPRSDLYSVGAVLYWMLSGHELFEAQGLQNLLADIVTGQPQPFARELGVPAALEAIVFRCLSKIPSERYANMATLQVELESVVLERHWTHNEAAHWWQTHLPDYWRGDLPHQLPGFSASNSENSTVNSTDRSVRPGLQTASVARDH